MFGDYISVYDIQRAVEDGATVPIYYESRLAQLELDEEERPKLDAEFEEVTEGEEDSTKERLKTKWVALEALVGTPKRLGLIAKDLLAHFDARQEALSGKAMIVCMSRRICVGLYDELVKLPPEWHHKDDDKGALKVVMTGSAPETEWQLHIRNKPRREALAKRFRDASSDFEDQASRVEGHGQALARPLGVPHHPHAPVAALLCRTGGLLQGAVHGVELVVARQLLDGSPLAIVLEDDEVAKESALRRITFTYVRCT